MTAIEVEQTTALALLFEVLHPRKFRLARAAGFEAQRRRTARRLGRDDGRARLCVREVVRTLKFFVQCRGEQNAFGKITKFHGSRIQRASSRAE